MNAVKRLQERARTDQRGLTLIELIIGMTLMGLIGTLCAAIFISSVRTQTNVGTSANASGQSIAFTSEFVKTVRSADSVRVTNSLRVDVKRADGRCVAYYAAGGSVWRSPATTTPVPAFSISTWKKVVNNVSKVSGADYFQNSPALGVKYSMATGSGMGKASLVGIATPRVVQGVTAPCW